MRIPMRKKNHIEMKSYSSFYATKMPVSISKDDFKITRVPDQNNVKLCPITNLVRLEFNLFIYVYYLRLVIIKYTPSYITAVQNANEFCHFSSLSSGIISLYPKNSKDKSKKQVHINPAKICLKKQIL